MWGKATLTKLPKASSHHADKVKSSTAVRYPQIYGNERQSFCIARAAVDLQHIPP
jgi:hypothetical protein